MSAGSKKYTITLIVKDNNNDFVIRKKQRFYSTRNYYVS